MMMVVVVVMLCTTTTGCYFCVPIAMSVNISGRADIVSV